MGNMCLGGGGGVYVRIVRHILIFNSVENQQTSINMEKSRSSNNSMLFRNMEVSTKKIKSPKGRSYF